MPTSKTHGGLIPTHSHGEHRDGQTDALISYQQNHGNWWLYFFGNWDTWRVNYCEHHRDARLPESFRRGKLTVRSLLTTLRLKCS
jgi:hypothetical protein